MENCQLTLPQKKTFHNDDVHHRVKQQSGKLTRYAVVVNY